MVNRLILDRGWNRYSQFGEDGILQYLIGVCGLNKRMSVEFGMSGKKFSNTYLLAEGGWDSLFMDKSEEGLKGVEYGRKRVQFVGDNDLDEILYREEIDEDFDVLSIDVDGRDWWIWKGLVRYRPKIVIIEVNPFLGADEYYVNDGKRFGSSFRALTELGNEKGYTLICMNGNMIFGRNDVVKGSEIEGVMEENSRDKFLDGAVMVNKRTFSYERYMEKRGLL